MKMYLVLLSLLMSCGVNDPNKPTPIYEAPDVLVVQPPTVEPIIQNAIPIQAEYDEHKQYWSISFEDPILASSGAAVTFSPYTLKREGATYTALLFYRQSKDWTYIDCHHVYMLLDGVPVDLEDSKWDGKVGSGFVVEFVKVPLAQSTVQQIEQASIVKIRICNDEFVLTPRTLDAFRNMMLKVRQVQ